MAVAMKAWRFVGLDKDVWLPADIEVIIDIVPSSRRNIRSNQSFTGQSMTTWHDTGNPNSNALGERNYLHSGAEGRYVGYNFAFDGVRIVQLTPLNEVTWAAGTPNGNKFSWHAEQCLNTDWDRALYVGAALHGGLCAAMGWDVDDALVKHQYWYGKWCPAQILNKGIWPQVVQMVKDAKALAIAAASGNPTPVTQYADASPIEELAAFNNSDTTPPAYIILSDGTPCYWVGYTVEALVDTPRLQLAYDGAPVLNEPVKKGSQFQVNWIFVADDGNTYYYSPWDTRFRVDDTKVVGGK